MLTAIILLDKKTKNEDIKNLLIEHGLKFSESQYPCQQNLIDGIKILDKKTFIFSSTAIVDFDKFRDFDLNQNNNIKALSKYIKNIL